MPEFMVRQCDSCGKSDKKAFAITSPRPMVYVSEDGQGVMLPVRADGGGALWYIDGSYVGEISQSAKLRFLPGQHQVYAIPSDGSGDASSVSFAVQDGE